MQQEQAPTVNLHMGASAALDVVGRRIRSCDLSKADLATASLDGLRGDGISLRGANLRAATGRGARLTGCDFRGATLSESDFSKSTLRLCTFDAAQARGARWEDARVEDSSLRGADFSGACLRGARLTESSWARARLHGANLDGARGDGVELRGADLSDASLVQAQLAGADFRGADLSRADLSGGDFRGADFRGAILDGVHWSGATCDDAQFDAEAADLRTPESPVAPASGPGDPDALAAALVGLVSQAVSTSARGNPTLEKGLGRVGAAWQSWQASIGEPAAEDIFGLLAGVESALGAPGLLTPRLAELLPQIRQNLGATDDVEPTEELKAWLERIVPNFDAAARTTSLDDLAARLSAAIVREASGSDR